MASPSAKRLHLVVPMSGSGSRFLAKGYTTPKPLIEVHGLPIIAHILERFPNVGRCTFICNQEHADKTPLVGVLQSLRPDANIRIIAPHKLGPVFAVQQAYDLIRDDEPVLVNYCDFDWEWSFDDFLSQMESGHWDGAVVGYTGFHPHLLGNDLYATMRASGSQLLEIREKHAFAANCSEELTSSGTYFFATGATLKWAMDTQVAKGPLFKGEHYISSCYQHLIDAGKRIAWHPVTRFCQWGTPQDLEEYLRWSDIFARRTQPTQQDSLRIPNAILLMAGHGSRFAAQGYPVPKPFIPLAGSTMAQQSLQLWPKFENLVTACRSSDLQTFPQTFSQLATHAEHAAILALDQATQGQACTARLALDKLPSNNSVLVLSCDSSLPLNHAELQRLMDEEEPDAIVLAALPHQPALWHPHRYGWIEAQGSRILRVSTKIPLSTCPANDPLVTGAFWFRSPQVAAHWIDTLVNENLRTNQEFYLDDVLGLMARRGANVRLFLVDQFVSWGTPEELRTFEYWQNHFDQSRHHPYCMEHDRPLPPAIGGQT